MGISSKKQKSKQHQTFSNTSHATTTPNVPDWLLKPAQQQAGVISDLMSRGPASFTPQASGAERAVWDRASGLAPSGRYSEAAAMIHGAQPISAPGRVADVTADQVGAGSVLDGLDRYYSPFKDQVTNPVLSDFDEQAGITRAAQAAQAANGAFRGSRYGVREAQTEGELARGRAATEGGLLRDMYSESTRLASGDRDRDLSAAVANQGANLTARQSNQQSALTSAGFDLDAARANQDATLRQAGLLTNLGQAEGDDTRANLELQGNFAGRQTDMENLARQYPLEFAKQTGGLLTGLNPATYIGQTVDGTESGVSDGTSSTKSSGSLLENLGQVAQIAATAAAFSDARLKRDVRTVGFDAKGRRWVEFAYLWAPLKRVVGVIAQEVAKSDPGAVIRHPSGFLMVNYGALD